MTRTVCILSYDISSAKRRRKIVKALEGSARRIQYSVFETFLPEGRLQELIKSTAQWLDVKAGDSLLVYRLCSECARRRNRYGGAIIDWEEVIIFE